MSLVVWLMFGFGLGVIFTASALSYFARRIIQAIGDDMDDTLARLEAEHHQ
jgi:hypothetical protein